MLITGPATRSLIISVFLSVPYQARCENFHGISCNDGCPDVKAGYDLARDQNTRDPYLCSGHSSDFYRGCMQYIYEAGPANPPDTNKDQSPDAGDTNNRK